MRPLIVRVGRLQRLAVFEAAARLGTFTAAAAELHMTQPGVTRHIRALEAELGITLFRRGANRALLSAAGARLLESVGQGFAIMESGLEQLAAEAPVFVLAANPGVAQRWLVPRLDELQHAVGDPDLRLWLFDRNAELAGGSFDAAIHAGTGDWPGVECELLFPEITMPVATPELAAQLGLDDGSPAQKLLRQPLLHLDAVDRPWMSWSDWFAGAGEELSSGAGRVSFNNYAVLLHEAIAGRGIALAWRYLVDELLAQGLLVEVGPEVRSPTVGYYLLWPRGGRGESVQRLAGWLRALIAA